MFGKLLPREGNFFEMFNQHAERIVEAARAFSASSEYGQARAARAGAASMRMIVVEGVD